MLLAIMAATIRVSRYFLIVALVIFFIWYSRKDTKKLKRKTSKKLKTFDRFMNSHHAQMTTIYIMGAAAIALISGHYSYAFTLFLMGIFTGILWYSLERPYNK